MPEKPDYKAADTRYDGRMPYIRCGHSGVRLPAVSLGFWHNFGSVDDFDKFPVLYIGAVRNTDFTADELYEIDSIINK